MGARDAFDPVSGCAGTIRASFWVRHPAVLQQTLRQGRRHAEAPPNVPDKRTTFFIQGVTLQGRTFRPSDWAERLAGAMSSFRPAGTRGRLGAPIGYSPYCVPRVIGGVKCVIVNQALRDIEPRAWDFVMSFARDNQLQVTEGCELPDEPA